LTDNLWILASFFPFSHRPMPYLYFCLVFSLCNNTWL
jgi:hypothetical protein